MNLEELNEIFANDDYNMGVEGDTAFNGLKILAKYAKNDIISGASHDCIYSIDTKEAINNGITKEDVDALKKLNWMIDEDNECFSHFV